MAIARMIIVDPESDRACSGNCRHLDRLALEAFVGDGLSVTTISRVPERTHASEPDLVVLRTPTRQPLADALRPLREVWRSTPILAAICNISDNIAELSESLRRSLDDFFCCPVQRLDIVTRMRRLMPEQRFAFGARSCSRRAQAGHAGGGEPRISARCQSYRQGHGLECYGPYRW
jgi:hypothetical protein